jgi:hypothetical protein
MKRSIIIIDDFYSDPNKIREYALNQNYPQPDDNYTYPGKNSENGFYPIELHQKFEKILNRKLIPAPRNGYFRISLEKDSYKQYIHVDPNWEFGAVCYLNPPYQSIDEGGTSFWIHNETRMEKLSTSNAECEFYGCSSQKEFWYTTVYGDGLDPSKWTRYLLATMKYNRIVIFRSNLWHSHNYNFGNSLENGRLVQLFFFNPTEWQ